MADPSGYKTFSPGEVLDAAEGVMAYLMDQVVGVYADSSARATAIGTAAEGQVSYLKDTNKVYLYNGSAWEEVGGGIAWSGSTANGLGTYSSSSEIVAESTATYDGTTLQLTTSGGGLKMDGLASSNANTLDDYEEGSFTGGLTAGSGTITVNGDRDQLAYTKIGRLVLICGTLEMTSVSTPDGTLTLTGLPFTSAGSGTGAPERSARIGFFFWAAGLVSGEPDWFGEITESAATAKLTYGAGGTGSGGAAPAAQIDGGSFLQFSMSYIAAT